MESTGPGDGWVERVFVRRGLGPLGGREVGSGGDPGRKENEIGINFGDKGEVGDNVLGLYEVEGMEACGALTSCDCGACDIRSPIWTVADDTTEESRRCPK